MGTRLVSRLVSYVFRQVYRHTDTHVFRQVHRHQAVDVVHLLLVLLRGHIRAVHRNAYGHVHGHVQRTGMCAGNCRDAYVDVRRASPFSAFFSGLLRVGMCAVMCE